MKRTIIINRRLKSFRGMTLVEVLISLVILMILLGAVYQILHIQQSRANQVNKTTVLQTDAQVAFTLLKWDMLLTGLGYPYDQTNAFMLPNSPWGTSAVMHAVGLGFEMARCHWAYLLANASGNFFLARRWDDSLANFMAGDTIMIVNESRSPVYTDLVVATVDTMSYMDSTWGIKIPAQKVTLAASTISCRAGLLVFRRAGALYTGGINYHRSATGDTLYRGAEPLLNNVEALEIRYGFDSNGDNIIDTWSNQVQPNPNWGRKWAIRYTMVVASEAMAGYRYPLDSFNVEGVTYGLTTQQRAKKRVFLQGVVYPQNLQPPEGM